MVRSSNAQRQTLNAMKQMQLLVRVQTQIQSRRVQMLENQHQKYTNSKEVDNDLSKWSLNQLVLFLSDVSSRISKAYIFNGLTLFDFLKVWPDSSMV